MFICIQFPVNNKNCTELPRRDNRFPDRNNDQGVIKLPLYSYKVVDSQGSAREGRLSAGDKDCAIEKLRSMSYTVIDVTLHKEEIPDSSSTPGEGGFSGLIVCPGDLALIACHLSTAQRGGVALTDAIETLQSEVPKGNLRNVLIQVQKDVQSGVSLSGALSRHRKYFPHLFTAVIQRGESDDSLPEALSRLAHLMEIKHKIRLSISSVISQPLSAMVFSLIFAWILLALLIPGFTPVFDSAGLDISQNYPLTRVLILISGYLANPVATGIFVVIGVLGVYYTWPGRSPVLVNQLPLARKLVYMGGIIGFCQTFALLSEMGFGVDESLSLMAEEKDDGMIASIAGRISGLVGKGETLSGAMDKTRLFPRLAIQMVDVAEKSGSMADTMEQLTEYFQGEMEASAEYAGNLTGPLVMILTCILAGSLVMGILLPVLGVAGKIAG